MSCAWWRAAEPWVSCNANRSLPLVFHVASWWVLSPGSPGAPGPEPFWSICNEETGLKIYEQTHDKLWMIYEKRFSASLGWECQTPNLVAFSLGASVSAHGKTVPRFGCILCFHLHQLPFAISGNLVGTDLSEGRERWRGLFYTGPWFRELGSDPGEGCVLCCLHCKHITPGI